MRYIIIFSCFVLSTTAFSFPKAVRYLNNKQIAKSSSVLNLELEDIIDDDVDFLAQLRRQIENPLNASPREVTNRIKGFFSGVKRNQKDIGVFRSYLDANKHVFDSVNAILILEGSDRSAIQTKDLVPNEVLLEAMTRPSPLLTSSMVYRGISCIKKMKPDDEFTKSYLKLLWERVAESKVILSAEDVCPSIYCIQNVNANSIYIKNFLTLFAKSLSATDIQLPAKTISSALFGLKRMKSASPEVRQLLQEIANKIKASEAFYHSVNVCIALNGLQNMDDGSSEVRAVLTALMDKAIPANEQGIDRAGDREISMALFGLQRMGGAKKIGPGGDSVKGRASPELRRVLTYITSLVTHFDVPFEAKRLGFALCGLSSLSYELPEVQRLVSELAIKTRDCWGDISGHELSMCLHGMAGLQSDSKAVRDLVSGIIPLIRNCPSISAPDVASAMLGLQGLRTTSKEVCQLAGALADLLERSKVTIIDSGDACDVLYGLQGISSTEPEGRRLLGKIPAMIRGAEALQSGRHLAASLGGLKSCDTRHPETLGILKALTPRFATFKGDFTVQNVALALYGLQSMKSGSKELNKLLLILTPLIANATGIFNPKGIFMAINGLQGLSSEDEEVRGLIVALATLLEKSLPHSSGFEDFHQLSGSLAGLAYMNGNDPSVRKLTDVLSRLIAITENHQQPSSISSSSSTTTSPAATISGSSSSNNNSPKKVAKWEPGQAAIKADRVTMALFGLQGMPLQEESFQIILSSLLGPARRMTPPDCRSVGKIMQGFRSSIGVPSPVLEELLLILATKIPGWSKRGGGGGGEIVKAGSNTKYSERNIKQKKAAVAVAAVVATNNRKSNTTTTTTTTIPSFQNNENISSVPVVPVVVPLIQTVDVTSSTLLVDITETNGSGRSGSNTLEFTLRGCLYGISQLDRNNTAVQAILLSLVREILSWEVSTLEPRTVETILSLFRGNGRQWMFAYPEIGQLFSKYIKGKKPTVKKPTESNATGGISTISRLDHDWVMPMEEYLRMVQDMEKGWLATEVSSTLSSLKGGVGGEEAEEGRGSVSVTMSGKGGKKVEKKKNVVDLVSVVVQEE